MPYGLYLYGSEQRHQSLATSDVDLMLITTPEHFDILKVQLAKELIGLRPEWKTKRFDVRFIPFTKLRPLKSAEVFGLAELWERPRAPLLGEDLVPQCYKPSWNEYHQAILSQIHYWRELLVNPPIAEVLARLQQAGTVKPIYNLQYYLSLVEQLKRGPGQYFFSSEDLQDPTFQQAKEFLRVALGYKFPQNPEHLSKLQALLHEIRRRTVARG